MRRARTLWLVPAVSLLAIASAQAKPPEKTTTLPDVEFEPKSQSARVSFSLEDASLSDLVRVMGQMTGKRFLLGGNLKDIKATVYSPEKVTVAEAYQGFLSILTANGLTVVPHGRFLKIVESAGVASQATPIYPGAIAVPDEERYVTRLHRLQRASVDEAVALLAHFKSKDGDLTAYAPGNLLIMTDTATNTSRMLSLVQEIDVDGAAAKMWLEPVHYASASDLARELGDVLLAKAEGGSGKGSAPSQGPPRSGAGAGGPLSRIFSEERSNSLILVGTEPGYFQALSLLRMLDVPRSGSSEIHVLRLEHTDATEISRTLMEVTNGSEGGGPGGGPLGSGGPPNPARGIFEGRLKVSADKATNSIIVTSSARDYAALHGVVAKLDQARRQVFIEAVILDLQVSRSNTFSSNFHVADTTSSSSNQGLLYGGLNPTKTIGLPDSTSLQGLALGVRGPGLPGTETLLGTGVSIPAFGILMNALASTTGVDVLSTPIILASDNTPAEINVGQNIPLQTNVGAGISLGSSTGSSGSSGALSALSGGTGGSGAAPRQDVGTKIKVTPHMNDSNEVRLELSEEISEASATPVGSLGTVSIVKRTAQTTLTAHDGQTLVIGGLMRSRASHSENKIPILGDIPLVGVLFKQTTSDMQKSNLVLVLTPYIIREQEDLRAVFQRKMQERQEFLDQYFVFSADQKYEAKRDYRRANGLLEDIRQATLKVDEERALQELTKPREVLEHQPQTPISPVEAPSGAPALGPPPPPPSSLPLP